MNVYSSFIRNYQNLETSKMFFSRWIDKQFVVYQYNGILFIDKNKIIKPWNDMEEPRLFIAKLKIYIYCKIPTIYCYRKTKL